MSDAPATPESSLSRQQYKRRRYHALKAKGICTTCESRQARPGKPTCETCQVMHERASERYRATHREILNQRRRDELASREAARLCKRCGKIPPEEGHKWCPACDAASREYHRTVKAGAKYEQDRAKYAERKAAGVCTQCAVAPPAAGRARCDACLADQRQRSKRHAERHPDKVLERSLKAKFGITLADKMAMLDAQGGRCPGCQSETPKHASGWAVDHCHETGKVRGILCQPCNIILGMAKDTPLTLERLARYLVIRGALGERQASLIGKENA